MIKRILPLLLLAVFGCNDDDGNNNDNISSQDKEFMAFAKEANLAEIDAGQLASTKGAHGAVRNYGQMMVTEHNTAKSSLDSLANALSITLADTISQEHQAMKQMFNSMSGYAFDTAYIGAQIRDHQKVIQKFQNEVQNGKHSSIKGYASRYLPHLQMHLTTADSIKTVL